MKSRYFLSIQSTREGLGLPENKSRYLMGVGYPLDIVICVAFGCDLFDCVYPTRTARFGTVLVDSGVIRLKNHQYATDQGPIDPSCDCSTCDNFTRAYLHHSIGKVMKSCYFKCVSESALSFSSFISSQSEIYA